MEAEHGPIRCIVADDHPAIVSAVVELLTAEGIDVVGRARNGDEAIRKIDATQPDVAIVDMRMPRVSGIEIARERGETVPIILYTAHGDKALLVEAVDAGARGYVLKEAPLSDLVRAVEAVARGGTYVDPTLAGSLADPAATERIPALTRRERDVLRLLADGLSNEEVAKRLFISPETVRTHVRKAMRKLDADTRTQAVATALRQQLIA